MNLLSKITDLVSRQATIWTRFELKDENAPLTDILPNQAYLRFWVTDMYITHDREWFKSKAPSVNASVSLDFGNQPRMKFSKITRSPEEIVTKGAFNDYAVTDLVPYSGGLVQVDAQLFTVNGPNELGAAIDILEGFSGLVVTPLGGAISIAKQVNDGIDKFLKVVNGDVQLAFNRTFSSAGGGGDAVLQPNYICVITAPEGKYKHERFSVKNSQLHYIDDTGKSGPFDESDFILLRMEGREERDDWSRLKSIEDNRKAARKAILANEKDKSKALQRAVVLAIYDSEDLIDLDKTRVTKTVLEEFKRLEGLGLGVAGEKEKDLNKIMESAVSTELAKAEPLSLDDALGQLE